ncbi:YdcF family protein [Catenovulum agarivorans]|uniref:YdcF family protein n=1 Tax=Catenovulum agarivorans TaxID=1172192 RepID=UPI0002E2B672|nr:ElyC/SanA/YdcF family protein [Catenovulum agarivorans]
MDLFFTLKKLIGWLISPLPISISLAVFGYVLLYCANVKPKWPKMFIGCGLLLLLVSSLPIVSHSLIKPIEFSVKKFDAVKMPTVDNIIVLGCYSTEDKALPDIANIHECSLYRIVEAYRLSKVYPKAAVILSGWGKGEERIYSHPEYLANYLIKLGLEPQRIMLSVGNKDTVDEAIALAKYMRGKKNLLVSSASHFKRINKIFGQQKLDFTPVPTEYLTKDEIKWHWHLLLPQASALHTSQRAWYEYLGNAWESLKQMFASS